MNEDSIFKRLPLQYIVLCIFTDRPRTPEVVIHAPMEKKGLASSIQTKPPNSAAPPPQQKPPSFQPPAQPPTRNPPAPAAPAPQPPRAPPSGPPLPSQNNVMQPRSSTMMNPPSRMNQAGPNSAMGGAATSPSITNCDISNTTDNTAMFQMPNHQSRQQPQQPPTVQPRGRSREPLAPQPPMFQVTSTTSKGQANYSQASRPRGRLGNFLQP